MECKEKKGWQHPQKQAERKNSCSNTTSSSVIQPSKTTFQLVRAIFELEKTRANLEPEILDRIGSCESTIIKLLCGIGQAREKAQRFSEHHTITKWGPLISLKLFVQSQEEKQYTWCYDPVCLSCRPGKEELGSESNIQFLYHGHYYARGTVFMHSFYLSQFIFPLLL